MSEVPHPEVTRSKYRWRQNPRGKWAWFEGKCQTTGAYDDYEKADDVFSAHCLSDHVPTPPTQSDSFETHPEFERLKCNYRHLTVPELEQRIAKMTADIASHQHVAKREFNGNGKRRTGAAVSAQAAREIAEERMLLTLFLEHLRGQP